MSVQKTNYGDDEQTVYMVENTLLSELLKELRDLVEPVEAKTGGTVEIIFDTNWSDLPEFKLRSKRSLYEAWVVVND